MKFNDAIDKFLTFKKSEVRASTIKYYEGKVPMIRRYLGDMNIDDIDKFVIADFTEEQRERNPTITNRTLNHYRQVIRHIVEVVTDRKIKVRKLKVSSDKVRGLSDNIVNKIMDHLFVNRNKGIYPHYYKYYFMFSLMLDTGARINEIVHIENRNIDIADRSILLTTTKNGNQRYVFFTEEVALILQKYLNRYKIKGQYLFVGADEKNHLTKFAVIKFLEKLQKRLKIDRSISSHKFRHTMAERYMKNHGGIYSLQKLLGHTDITTTTIYADIGKEELKKIYNKTMKNKL